MTMNINRFWSVIRSSWQGCQKSRNLRRICSCVGVLRTLRPVRPFKHRPRFCPSDRRRRGGGGRSAVGGRGTGDGRGGGRGAPARARESPRSCVWIFRRKMGENESLVLIAVFVLVSSPLCHSKGIGLKPIPALGSRLPPIGFDLSF